ncbi:hypothetical protein HKBW3S25_00497 [Candidatus Hakubella thermalkaliphila]|uniref:Uncharacterized protein n=1 Tax=Candidatus Hakubella thermalkaliphila TaxID=2754717 RepID=A0A6V8NXX1_9ACTN|nr:hypothetical protein HKBW3S25_00497 [Candidatus Hakubella thermalkaliphila]
MIPRTPPPQEHPQVLKAGLGGVQAVDHDQPQSAKKGDEGKDKGVSFRRTPSQEKTEAPKDEKENGYGYNNGEIQMLLLAPQQDQKAERRQEAGGQNIH